MATATPTKPMTVDEFDVSNLTIGNSREYADHGFVKHYLIYDRGNIQDNKLIVKFENVKIKGVYAPGENSTKNGMKCAVEDEAQIQLLTSLEDHIKNIALSKNEEWFEDGELEMDDIEASFKPMLKFNDKGNYHSFTVNFPFMVDEVKDAVTLQYLKGCGEPTQEMLDSNDLLVKLPYNSVVDLFLNITNVKIENSSKEFNIQRTVFKRINVKKIGQSSSDGASNGPRPGRNVEEIDVSKIVMGDVITNDRQGRSLKPKYGYTNASGEEKLGSLTVNLPGVKVSFRRQIDNEGKSSFNVVYRLNEDHLSKFEEIDEHLKQEFYSNFGKYESGKKLTKKMLDKKFRGAVKHSDDYPANMWYSVYATADESGDGFDFKGNFYKPDGTQYTNDEVLNDIFGNTLVCDLNVYLKHIWFVASKGTYSAKFNVGSVVVDTASTNVEYDLGDAHIDTIKSPSGSTSEETTTKEEEEEEHVSSDPEDSSAVPSEEEED